MSNTILIEAIDQNTNSVRISRNIISKYEKTRLISTRASQIENNSPIFTDITSLVEKDPISIATKEYNEKTIPLGIRRILPNGEIEDFFIRDMIES